MIIHIISAAVIIILVIVPCAFLLMELGRLFGIFT